MSFFYLRIMFQNCYQKTDNCFCNCNATSGKNSTSMIENIRRNKSIFKSALLEEKKSTYFLTFLWKL